VITLRLVLSGILGFCVGHYISTGERWAIALAVVVLFVRVLLDRAKS
jgi:hypothetical protein